jgi:hypothetical protein
LQGAETGKSRCINNVYAVKERRFFPTHLWITGNISGRGDANFGTPAGEFPGYQGTIKLSGNNTFSDPLYSGDVGVWGGSVKILSSNVLSGSDLIKIGFDSAPDMGGQPLLKDTPLAGTALGRINVLAVFGLSRLRSVRGDDSSGKFVLFGTHNRWRTG